jgi:membrane protein EpsK
MTQPEVLAEKRHLRAISVSSARRGFAVNVASNVAFTVTSIVVAMWFTPYLIGHLGVAVFGIIALASSIVAYLSILTNSLNASVTRFLAIDLNREDNQTANETFNTALFSLLGIVAIVIPIALLFSLVLPYLFDVPSGFEVDTSWFFVVTAFALCIGVVTTSFSVTSFAHSRFVLRNVVSLAAMFARIGLVVLLFSFFSPRLWHVGLGLLMAGVVALVGHLILWRKLTPGLQVSLKAVNRAQMRPLLEMGGWVTVRRTGSMLLKNFDVIIVFSVFGAVAAGGYAALLQIRRMPRKFLGAGSSVISPIILQKYAQGDFPGLRRITLQATKLLGLGLALPVGLICGLSRPFLSIWLDPSFEEWSPVLIALTALFGLNLSMRPAGLVQSAYNKVRWPGIAMVASGVINVLLAIAVAKWTGWGPLGIAIVGALVITTKNVFFFPVYTAHIMGLPWHTFFPTIVTVAASTFAVGLAAYGLTLVQMPTDWLSLGITATVVSLAYAIVVGLVVLNEADRQLLKSVILRRV